MQLLGIDTVVFAYCERRELLKNVMQSYRAIWPTLDARISGDDGRTVSILEIALLPPIWFDRGSIPLTCYFSCNTEMFNEFRSRSFNANKDVESTVALIIRERNSFVAHVESLNELAVQGSERVTYPYDALLACHSMTEVTVITANSPQDDLFAKKILEATLEAILSTRERR